jgi:hypothetical protein
MASEKTELILGTLLMFILFGITFGVIMYFALKNTELNGGERFGTGFGVGAGIFLCLLLIAWFRVAVR